MGAIAEARSVYLLEDRASPTMRAIRQEGERMLPVLDRVGAQLDRIGTKEQIGRVEAYSERVRGLRTEMVELGAVHARPSVEVQGIAAARSELALLRAELAAFDRRSAQARVGVSAPSAIGAAATVGTARTITSGGGQGLRSVGFGPLNFGSRTGLALIGAAIPAARGLIGGAGALTATVGGAAIGAGAVGYGAGLGTAVAGYGALAGIAKPLAERLKLVESAQKAVTGAQDQYNAALQEYGRRSDQAAAAERALNAARRERNRITPQGAREFLQQRRGFSQDWRQATQPGQQALLGLGSSFFADLRGATPRLAGASNEVAGAAQAQGSRFSDFLTAERQLTSMERLTGAFANNLDEGRRITQNLVLSFSNVARASIPFFHEGMVFVEGWTEGWADSSSDIEGTRRAIGGYVDDLRAVADLTGSAIELTKDLFGPARPEGRTMVEDLTATLDRWDRWVERNPAAVTDFWHEGVESTEKIAEFLGHAVSELNRLGDALGPIMDQFLTLANLGGGAGLFLPMALRYGVGRAVGGAGAAGGAGPTILPGGGAPAAGGAAAAAGLGAGYLAARGGAYPTRGGGGYIGGTASRIGAGTRVLGGALPMGGGFVTPEGFASRYGGVEGSRYAMPTSQLGTRSYGLSRLGAPLGNAARAGGRFLAPVSLAMGALDFATFDGSPAERGQAALSGASLGIIPRPLTGDEKADQGVQGANTFLDFIGRRFDDPRNQLAEIGKLRGSLRRNPDAEFFVDPRTGVDVREREGVEALAKVIDEEYRVRRDLVKQLDREEARGRLAKSRARGMTRAADLQEGFGVNLKAGMDPDAAFGDVADATLSRMEGMRRAGARVLGDNMLEWGRAMEARNPELVGVVDSLGNRIERRMQRMGRHVAVVNGQIYTTSEKDWKRIADAIGTYAERARQRASSAFTALQRQAFGQLQGMGFSSSEARALVSMGDASSSKADRQSAARTISGDGVRRGDVGFGTSDAARTGDGWGDRMGDGKGKGSRGPQGLPGRQGSVSLAGADPDLAPYAADAARFGLSVSSGLRPGSITSAGNTSFHASGRALDLAGSPDAMLSFAQHAARAYGSRLEELIHTPLGFSISDGQRVAPYATADHYDHVHLADTGAPGRMKGAGLMVGGDVGAIEMLGRLKAPRSGMGGVGGAMADRAGEMLAVGMRRKINDAIRKGRGLGGGGAYDGGVMTFGQVARLAESVGLPGVTFAQIAKGESGFNPAAIGHDPGGTLGLGLWQITTSYNDDIIAKYGGRDAMLNPRTNALAARDIYERQGIGAWYGTRYMTGPNLHYQGDGWGQPSWGGWHAKGGRGRATRPTIIGVGEGGPAGEDVFIRPNRGGPSAGRSSGTRRPLVIEQINVTYAKSGDMRDAIVRRVREEVAEAFDELADELLEGSHDEDALLA